MGLSNNSLTQATITNAPYLQKLLLSDNKITDISLQNLPSLTELNLQSNKLQVLNLDSLENSKVSMLYLDRNQLQELPNVSKFTQLCQLFVSDNRIRSLPENLAAALPISLTHLDLTTNQIDELPIHITHFKNLSRLSIGNNYLKELPAELALIESLQVLTIENNPLRTMRKVLDKNTTQILEFLRNRLPLEKIEAVECTAGIGQRHEQNRVSDLDFSQVTLKEKQLTSLSGIFDHYPDLDP